jgi:hypothetical protein
MARRITAVLLAGLLAGCSSGVDRSPGATPSPTGDPERWRDAPGVEPYPFVTPVPPLADTPIDGEYHRNFTAGSEPIPCRRCAPYRLNSGEAVLTLREGRFRVDHPAWEFTSGGHYFVDGARLILINDPNCPETRGIYGWTLRGDSLALEVVEDDCAFDLLRARYLSAAPWTAS